MSEYWFDVIDVRQNVLHHVEETRSFPTAVAAHQHFKKMIRTHSVQGYYYLCGWGEAPRAKDNWCVCGNCPAGIGCTC